MKSQKNITELISPTCQTNNKSASCVSTNVNATTPRHAQKAIISEFEPLQAKKDKSCKKPKKLLDNFF